MSRAAGVERNPFFVSSNVTQATSSPSGSPTSAARQHFGTDGVRGVANTELSPQLAMSLGAAAARVLHGGSSHATAHSDTVVVGRDPRLSGDLLGAALTAGLCSQGVDVLDIGVIPTPGVSFVTRARGAVAGVVISASHNPVQDNGIKFFGPDGKKLADAVEARIEAAMAEWESYPRPTGADVGRVTRTTEPVADYLRQLAGSLSGTRLDGMRLVIDCANGAASYIAADLLRSLGAEVVALYAEPDGVNINAGCGSLHPEAMAAEVAQRGFDAGLAFDGDADRVILADGRGRIFDGDRILYTVGAYLKQQGRLANDVVVGTIMSNLGLEQALTRRGVRLVRAAVGDRYVAEEMAKAGAVLGGEKSGHILFPELSPTGDGLLTGLQVLRISRESGKPLDAWADEVTELPQKLVSVKVRDKEGWESVPEIAVAIAEAEQRLAGRGRINVRPSGTEKLIRVMAEGPDAAEVDQVVAQVVGALKAARGV
jgi:phosphoglucosamine mutase